jgi:hypothetical protein
MVVSICPHTSSLALAKMQPASAHQQMQTLIQHQVSLQHKYLVEQEPRGPFLNRFCSFLNSYMNALKQNHLIASMQRTSHGATGFTFICATPTDLIKNETQNTVIRFVLKWQNDMQNKLETLGAHFFRLLGFKPPIPIPLQEVLSSIPQKITATPTNKQTLISQMTKVAQQKVPAMTGESTPIIMPAIHGVSLDDFIETEDLFRLSKKDQIRLLVKIGTIAFGDLLIGNDDRVFSFEKGRPAADIPIKFNSGNLLVAVEPRDLDPKKGKFLRFKAVYPIDNCPSVRLIGKAKKPMSDEIDLGSSFFETEIDRKENSYTAAFSEYESSSDSSLEYQLKADNACRELHTAFVYFKERLSFLAARIFQGFKAALPPHNPDLLVSPLQAKKALTKGLEIGMKKAKNKKHELQGAQPHPDFGSNELRAYTLFTTNLSSL